MADESPTGVKRRGFRSWKRWLLACCLLPVVAFGLSNLGLDSRWGRRWLAAKIQNRCGLPTTVGAASWSPWHGITLTDLEVSQPAALQATVARPLLRIDSLRLEPGWRAAFKGHLEIRSLTLERPRLVLTVEMLSMLAQQQAPVTGPVTLAAQAQPPAVALNPPLTEGPPQIPSETPPAAGQPPTPPATAPAPPPAPPAPARPTAWLRLHFASFELVAANATRPVLRLDDLNGDIPFAGEAAKATVRLGQCAANGHSLITDLEAELSWQYPVLMLEPANTELNGVALRLAGKIGLVQGLPMYLAVQVPEQPLAVPLPLAETSFHADSAVLNARLQGFLVAPGSWQGELIADASAITVKHGGVSSDFRIAHCGTLLRSGILSCVDARLLSDDLSLLGNATLLVDGRLGGIVRLVTSPDRTTGLVQRLFPDVAAPLALTPLSTPQRVAFDLSVFGTLHEPQLQLGQDGPTKTLQEALSTKHEALNEEATGDRPMTSEPVNQ